MPITADGYYEDNGAWKGGSDGKAELGTKSASHAERVAYKGMGTGKTFYLFVQNGFPCGDCLTFFKSEAAERYFIFIVTADQGSYSMDNGFSGFQIAFPQIVYINSGKVTYPGYVQFWTHHIDAQNQRITTKEERLRSITDAGIFRQDGTVKKPPTWPDFPSIRPYC